MPQPARTRETIFEPATSVLALTALTLLAGAPAFSQTSAESPVSPVTTHLGEDVRSSLGHVMVIPGDSPAERDIGGTYRESTPGLAGGAAQGAAIGRPSVDVGGVTVATPIPILTIPGAILGGLSGATKREIQEFRDTLANEIDDAASQPLTHDKLARQVFQNIRPLPAPESGYLAPDAPVPANTDAMLYAKIEEVSIDVDGTDAILTTRASVRLERREDAARLYERSVFYQDRASLSEWTKRDNALFRDYANFALHYLGRELAAETFTRVSIAGELSPAKSDSVKLARRNTWEGETRSLMPTIAWQWANDNNAPAPGAVFDIEVYDARRPVYSATRVTGSSHTLPVPLEACGTYRWSVRPAWQDGDSLQVGPWMRRAAEHVQPAGLTGRDATRAPAYTQDFALLEVHCRAK